MTMTHRYYLDSENEERKVAFLDGCRAMMMVLSHCPLESIGTIASRTDDNWIYYLCEKEEARAEQEERNVTASVLQNYKRLDIEEFRGMLLNCGRINDDGLEVDEDGKTCKHHSFPNQVYEYMCGEEYPPRQISNDEYEALPPNEKSDYKRRSYIELLARYGDRKRQFSNTDSSFMTLVLQALLPHETPAVLKLYRKALHEKNYDTDIMTYRDLFECALDIYQHAEESTPDPFAPKHDSVEHLAQQYRDIASGNSDSDATDSATDGSDSDVVGSDTVNNYSDLGDPCAPPVNCC